MKRMVGMVALVLAGCSETPREAAVADNAAVLQRALEAEADRMEALADNVADPEIEQALENAADRLDDAKDEVGRDARAARAQAR